MITVIAMPLAMAFPKDADDTEDPVYEVT